MTEPTLHKIRVEDIQVINRQRKDMGDLGDLIDSMKSEGQLQPGLVCPVTAEDIELRGADPDVPWKLVAGERRYRAVIMAGLDTYLAVNRGELTELQYYIFELKENLHRKDMTWDEEAASRAKIHALRVTEASERGESWTLKDTARELGESHATISRDIAITAAIKDDPSLKDAGSKKAAGRILEFRAHVAKEQASMTRGPHAKVQELLRCEDGRTWIRRVETGAVSAVITDLPYGGDFHSLGMKREAGVTSASDYDDTPEVTLDFFVDMVPEMIRVTKETGWICCFMSESNYGYLRDLFESCCTTHLKYGYIHYVDREFGEWEKVMPEKCIHHLAPEFGNSTDPYATGPCNFLRAEVPGWIWYRPNSHNPSRFPERHAKNFHEEILLINRGSARLYKQQDECPNVLVFDSEYGNERIHSMQKPLDLGMELASRLTMPGELIIDPCFGSGNLLAGAARIQRKIGGSETNPLVYEQAIVKVSKYYGG